MSEEQEVVEAEGGGGGRAREGWEIRGESGKVMPNISVMIRMLCWERRGQLGSQLSD